MPTQTEIAEHLGLSQAAVSKAMMKLTLDWRTSSMAEIRLAYLNRLRAEASGHMSSSGLDLVEEKAKTERVRRELAMMELMEKQGLLVNIDDIKGDITLALLNFKNALLSRNERLKSAIDAMYGIDLDITILQDDTHEALNDLARTLQRQGAAIEMDGHSTAAGVEDGDNRVGT